MVDVAVFASDSMGADEPPVIIWLDAYFRNFGGCNRLQREGCVRKIAIATAICVLLAATAIAQEGQKVIQAEDIAWKDHPFFKGAQTVVLLGDPSKPEAVVQRIKFPANFKVAPHTHPYSEVVTVISGSIGFGVGEKFDPSKGTIVKAGSINATPAKTVHFVWTGDSEAVVQIQFTGPGGIEFLNPADDPRRK